MQIVVNGDTVQVSGEGISVSELLALYELDPKHVIVEQNREIVDRGIYEKTRIKEADRLELVHIVGGG
ncbi:sulfur carrier protein ThiS [Pontibacillus halophilus JSM 076056 = DSM 19796]|uniref:Sulfur carrier protein ThiS n=1 Tax=Pontibacillus halophilus JSM 076056 = DSM 19796 TaxID=1385510 RepID=A0A0A5GMG6_9BACI|nr:sulfur carrier protein ThiS [Pontibacillus halophilus]KGX92418.1 sulfur carrier protein ThiS [Pontibacillus halophilus JSM 076056 = DSM 19796]